MSTFEVAVTIGGLAGGSLVAFACIRYLRQQMRQRPNVPKRE